MNRVTVPISPCGVPFSSTVLCGGFPAGFDLQRELFVCAHHLQEAEQSAPQTEEDQAIAEVLRMAREHRRRQREAGQH